MNMPKKGSRVAIPLICTLLLLNSCQKNLTVSKSEYQQYGIDQQVGEDSAVVKYYQPYKQKMQSEMDRVIGQTEQALTGSSDPETLLGNYFSDAILKEGRKLDPTIQCTLATKGGLRNALPAGNITVSNIFELMPFENELAVLKMPGGAMEQMLDFIARKGGQPVAGMRMKIKNGKAEDVEIGGEAFEKSKTYTLLTYDYLADGGDELSFLKEATSRNDLGQRVREALLQNIADATQAGKKINAELDGRITIEE